MSAPPRVPADLEPRSAQAKAAAGTAPPVYRPYPSAGLAAQKRAATQPQVPAVYRPGNSTTALQPKIGFEFEIQNWKVLGPSGSFHDKTKILTGPAWHAVGDVWIMGEHEPAFVDMFGKENVVSTGNLEFVTAAFEETDQGLTQLLDTLDSITAEVQKLAGSAVPVTPSNPEFERYAGYKASLGNNRSLWMNEKTALAKPQMSAGIKLHKVADVLETFGGAAGPDHLLAVNGGQEAAIIAGKARKVVAGLKLKDGVSEKMKSEYAGAIAHLACYIFWADLWKDAKYPKVVFQF